ncbi:hypothetical protein [Streptomyces sp. NPDC046942]|uniref:hypothetical protein n=1 Tax=Streptomyces sp. NPDC046942 TaxID=3155137 RepID=UPI0033DEFBC9
MKPTAAPGTTALRPVVSEPGALVHSAADRRLASEHWLMATCPASGHERIRAEWQENKVALLPLGTLFSAVRIPGRLIFATALTEDFEEVDAFLDDALKGGPVICDPHSRRYYALVPASMARTWHKAADEWRAKADVEVLGSGTYLGVPRLDLTEFDPQGHVSYWSVPMASAAALCAPLTVARLIAAGQHATPDDSR